MCGTTTFAALPMHAPPFTDGLRGANAERPQHALGDRSPRQYQQQRLRAAEWQGEESVWVGHGDRVVACATYSIVPS